jgi:hypothetical protein
MAYSMFTFKNLELFEARSDRVSRWPLVAEEVGTRSADRKGFVAFESEEH